MSVSLAPPEAPAQTSAGPGFTARLLLAQALVLVAMALTSWLVASAVGPGVFHEHLGRAGVQHTAAESDHVEEAFASSMLLALGAALLIAIILALAVSWYLSRRVQRSLRRVVTSAADVAAGDYHSRVASPGLGGEFDLLTSTFNALAQRLEAVEGTRRRMLADLAHEMRTPLATLEAHIEALEDGVRELDDATFSVLKSSTARLGRLAQDIGAVSRAQEGRLDISLEPTTPQRLVESAVRAAADRYRDKGVSLEARVSTDAPLFIDTARMGQVLGNLLENALRHTPKGGSVAVSAESTEGWVELAVEDTGEGIAQEHLGHLFDRFYRVDSARDRSHGGSGIGLTITKALVEAHGGRIWVHSAGPGNGSRFTVRLPSNNPRPRSRGNFSKS